LGKRRWRGIDPRFVALGLRPIYRKTTSRGIPRINMLVELGIALYRSRVTNGSHLWRDYEISFVSRRCYDGPEMLESYRVVKRKVPEPRRNVGGRSVFEASLFKDITVAALMESQKQIERRAGRRSHSKALERP